ncbi:MAG: M20/M25/M40 family metallo-hydrolase [Anaerolineae bacterium]|nr:M20/M25/M40 family metallo-hydrolase [Anaerolineae bacterium]
MSQPHTPDRIVALLRTLTPLPGIAGHEDAVIRALVDAFTPVVDAITVDRLGSLVARIGPANGTPRIVIMAHMDTVGLMIKHVIGAGLLGVVPVGGVNLKALPGTAVRIGDAGIPGVIGVRSQHLAQPGDTAITVHDLVIEVDPGAMPQITPAAPVTYAPQTVWAGGKLFSSPHLDNRAGCAVLVELAYHLAADPPPGTVYLIGTVQEETTCAGAEHVLAALAPDAVFAVDGTLSYDTPDTRRFGDVQLGAGPVLTTFLYVSGLNGWHAHPALRAHLQQTARDHNLPVQHDAIRGLMSDIRAAARAGIPSVLIGLPMRGKHGPLETVHLDDIDHTIRLLAATLRQPLPDCSRG